jgi:hypothetical protein
MTRQKRPLQDLICKGCGVTVSTHNRNRSYCSNDCSLLYRVATSGFCPFCGAKDADRLLVYFTPELRAEAESRGFRFAAAHENCRRGYLDSSGRSTECPCFDCARSRGESVGLREGANGASPRSSPKLSHNRIAVLERDAWTCQICQLPIARDAHVHDDLSPAVDHIIPRRDGGGDELENLRAAHRWRNIRREHPYFGLDAMVAEAAWARFGETPTA